jgi:hypothetical protein
MIFSLNFDVLWSTTKKTYSGLKNVGGTAWIVAAGKEEKRRRKFLIQHEFYLEGAMQKFAIMIVKGMAGVGILTLAFLIIRPSSRRAWTPR